MLPGESSSICMIYHAFPSLGMYYLVLYTDPALPYPFTTAGEELDDLSVEVSDIS